MVFPWVIKIQNRKARKYVNATAAQHGKVALRSLHFRSQTAHTVCVQNDFWENLPAAIALRQKRVAMKV